MNEIFTFSKLFRVITGPFYTIGIAMQLSVIPHLTIYGDVRPDQIKKGLLANTYSKIL
jgi:hypothetical protein